MTATPEFVELQHNTPEYRQTLWLRQTVLREPLGLTLTDDDLATEDRERHFALLDGPRLIGCVVAKPLGPAEWKLRQMAVAEAYRGQGHGRRLVKGVLGALAAGGAGQVSLHARANAVGFYERIGFEIAGEELVEVGVPHRRMVMLLKSA
ncbi:MAG: GNAT family N-acetyltransferase [Planctomycetota bacterium]